MTTHVPRLAPLAVLLLALLLAGCPAPEDEASDGSGESGPGLTKDDVTRHGDDVCAFDAEFRKAVEVAGFDGEVGPYPAGFDPVILHVGDQDYADSADSTDLYDVRGVFEICRWSIGDSYVAEAYLFWFGPTAERERLEDAQAWQYALDEVSFENPGAPQDVGINAPVPVRVADQRAAVTAVRASGGDGVSAGLSITVDGFIPDPDAPPRSLSAQQLSGPLPPEDQVVDLLGTIAEQLSAR